MKQLKTFDLEKLVSETGVDAALIFNIDGKLIKSHNVAYDVNISAMSGILLKMCTDLAEDVFESTAEQMMIKCTSGLFVASKLDQNNFIACITKENAKLGILLKRLETISHELKSLN